MRCRYSVLRGSTINKSQLSLRLVRIHLLYCLLNLQVSVGKEVQVTVDEKLPEMYAQTSGHSLLRYTGLV